MQNIAAASGSDTILVLHYTALDTAASLAAFKNPKNVSVHYMIDKDGVVISADNAKDYGCNGFVKENKTAWHTGVSYWRGLVGVNKRSIGIECVNSGFVAPVIGLDTKTCRISKAFYPGATEWEIFTEAQKASVLALAKDIVKRWGIKPYNVVGHADVSLGRKLDPGPVFCFKELAEEGVGLWPSDINRFRIDAAEIINDKEKARELVRELMAELGYGVNRSCWQHYINNDKYSKLFPEHFGDDYFLNCAIIAFKMHYLSDKYEVIDQQIDETLMAAVMNCVETARSV